MVQADDCEVVSASDQRRFIRADQHLPLISPVSEVREHTSLDGRARCVPVGLKDLFG